MSDDRRRRLMERLAGSAGPLSGTELGQILGATRQTVTQDVAILRARGEPIVATPRGYLLATSLAPSHHRALLAVRHRPDETEDELSLLLDLGLRVVDVVVDHPLYGELRGTLMLDSREDLREWLRGVRERGARLLSELTGGVHLHTVEAPRADLLERAREALRRRGYLLEKEGHPHPDPRADVAAGRSAGHERPHPDPLPKGEGDSQSPDTRYPTPATQHLTTKEAPSLAQDANPRGSNTGAGPAPQAR